jgi:DNA-binding IclR family transcriptional regulator
MEQTGETVELSILDNEELLCIEKIEGSESIRLFTQIGSRYRTLHASAPGKVHLAYMSPRDFEKFISEYGLPRLTENTITDVNVLKSQLEQILQTGVAFDDQERRLGVRRFASPIFDCNGKKIAVVDLAGPVFRLTLERKQHFAELVKKTAQRISKHLGFAGGI